jgi:dihydrofolate reductase
LGRCGARGRTIRGKDGGGANPPYHTPVFVLTRHARGPLEMEGGTTFCFVTEGVESALKQATEAAGGKDVRIGGGVSLLRQYLAAGQIDDMHLAVSPVLLGEGENLFAGINLHQLGYRLPGLWRGRMRLTSSSARDENSVQGK